MSRAKNDVLATIIRQARAYDEKVICRIQYEDTTDSIVVRIIRDFDDVISRHIGGSIADHLISIGDQEAIADILAVRIEKLTDATGMKLEFMSVWEATNDALSKMTNTQIN